MLTIHQYGVAAALEIALPTAARLARTGRGQKRGSLWAARWPHWLVTAALFGVYAVIMLAVEVPGCPRASMTPECNAAGFVDAKLLGRRHMYDEPTYIRTNECSACAPGWCPRPDAPAWCGRAFDPEGPVSSLAVVLTVQLGLHAGWVINVYKEPRRRLAEWLVPGALLGGAGAALAGLKIIPVNKNLWSLSYILLNAGMNMGLLALLYAVFDVAEWAGQAAQPVVSLGRNAMLAFVVGAQGLLLTATGMVVYRGESAADWLWAHVFGATWVGESYVVMALVLLKISLWLGLAWYLDVRRQWYWTV